MPGNVIELNKKYRVWCENKQEWEKDEVFLSQHGTLFHRDRVGELFLLKPDSHKVSFFTGLHDATTWDELTEDERAEWTRSGNMPSEWKGKPIYEGDRIKLLYNWHEQYCYEQYWTVKFTKGCFYLFHGDRLSMLYNFDAFEMKIIGNIWENHELLESKNGEY